MVLLTYKCILDVVLVVLERHLVAAFDVLTDVVVAEKDLVPTNFASNEQKKDSKHLVNK